MKVGVLGLWHLGSVTAACLAAEGHDVVGVDFEPAVVCGLAGGKAPIAEPGLDALLADGLVSSRLRFSASPDALADREIVWVAYDTPVDEDDHADVGFVEGRVERVLPVLAPGTLVLVSSQLPVGSVARLERTAAAARPGAGLTFACSPENLRLGRAIEVFRHPDRIVVGVRGEGDRERVARLLAFAPRVEWMSVESAEMTKHAINAFLANSVAFINEIASLCEAVGADAKEVERGLKSEQRIGPKAYLSPGGAFAGGTLARDIVFLSQLGAQVRRDTHLISAVRTSNNAHRQWARRRLSDLLGDVAGRRVAVWGLTYKPGTDTLRRSSALELCAWLADAGAEVRAHDPALRVLPDEWATRVVLTEDPVVTCRDADALVVATEWPAFRDVDPAAVAGVMRRPLVFDANRFLAAGLGAREDVTYVTVGKGVA